MVTVVSHFIDWKLPRFKAGLLWRLISMQHRFIDLCAWVYASIYVIYLLATFTIMSLHFVIKNIMVRITRTSCKFALYINHKNYFNSSHNCFIYITTFCKPSTVHPNLCSTEFNQCSFSLMYSDSPSIGVHLIEFTQEILTRVYGFWFTHWIGLLRWF